MKKFITMTILVAFAVTTFGCASLDNMSGGQQGAVLGGTLGALTGALIGGGTKTKILAALLGGAVGAGIGYWIGNRHDEQVKSRDQAMQVYKQSGVCTDQKQSAFAIDDCSVSKAVARPGDELMAGVQYTVLDQNPDAHVKVIEKRYLELDGDRFPLDTKTVNIEQGTHASVVKFTVPKDAGEYKIITVIEKDGKSIQAENKIKVAA